MNTYYNSKNHRIELSNEALAQQAPSIFASQAIAGVSDRYTFLPTSRIIDQMRANGWAPVSVEEQRVRLAERRGFQRHLIRFQHTNVMAQVGEYAPEIALLNSHDGSSAYQIHAALYRFVCANGLMVSDTVFNHFSIRHSGHETEEVLKASFEMLAKVPELTSKVELFKSRRLTETEAAEFAKSALTLRYEDPTETPIQPVKLLAAHRHEDEGSDLWSIFNRVQENLTQGGQKDYSKRTADGKLFGRTRAITGLDKGLKINKELWALAETFFSA